MKSPFNKLTIDLLRDSGYHVERVEHWNSFSSTRHDLLGVIDYLAFCAGTCVGVQSTSISCRAEHKKKILTSHGSLIWLLSGQSHLLLLVSWESVKIGRRKSWLPTVDIFTEIDFDAEMVRTLPPSFARNSCSGGAINDTANVDTPFRPGDAGAHKKKASDDAARRTDLTVLRGGK